MAITVTILMVLIFGMIDFGRVFHAYLTLNHASRESVRMASLGAKDTEINQTALASAASLSTEKVIVEITPPLLLRTRGTYVTVKMSYPVTITLPIIESAIPNPFMVKNETTMRVE
jgi:Flp pilus assembly protein TadG